jgi:ankyrin repeat protein
MADAHTFSLVLESPPGASAPAAADELAAWLDTSAEDAGSLLSKAPLTLFDGLARAHGRELLQKAQHLEAHGVRLRLRNESDPSLPRAAWEAPPPVLQSQQTGTPAAAGQRPGGLPAAHDVEVTGGDLPAGRYRLNEATRQLRSDRQTVDLEHAVKSLELLQAWHEPACLSRALPASGRGWLPAALVGGLLGGDRGGYRFRCVLRDGRSFTGVLRGTGSEQAWFALQAVAYDSACVPSRDAPAWTPGLPLQATTRFRIEPPRPHRQAEETEPVGADEILADADRALETERTEEAFSLYLMAAQAGARSAYLHLGRMALAGRGCAADPDRALSFFQQGREAGDRTCALERSLCLFDRGRVEAASREVSFACAGAEDPLPASDLLVRALNTCANEGVWTAEMAALEDHPDPGVAMAAARTREAADFGGALHAAAAHADADRLGALLAHGANPARPGTAGRQPLHWLCLNAAPAQEDEESPARTARTLLACGVPVDARDEEGASPLHYAISAGSEPLVDLLLQHGADPDQPDAPGRTALLRLLDPDAPGVRRTEPLVQPLVSLLLARDAEPDATDEAGRTPLYWCAVRQWPGPADALLASGADPGAHTADGRSIWWAAVAASSVQGGQMLDPHQQALLDRLLQAGAAVDERSAGGATALYFAVLKGKIGLAGLLLQHGADASARTHEGLTPLDRAVADGADSLVRMLESYGADRESTASAFLRRTRPDDADEVLAAKLSADATRLQTRFG